MPPSPTMSAPFRFRPFPLPFAVGTDVCHIPRLRRILMGKGADEGESKVNDKSNGKSKGEDVVADGVARKRRRLRERFLERVFGEFDGRWVREGEAGLEMGMKTGSEVEEGGGNGNGTEVSRTSSKSSRLSKRWLGDKKFFLGVLERKEFNEEEVEKVCRYLAGRWAAKEAVMKAHPHMRLTMKDVIIRVPPPKIDGSSVAPRAYIWPSKSTKIAGVSQVVRTWEVAREVRVSISHDGEYATAVCLAVEEGEENVGGEKSSKMEGTDDIEVIEEGEAGADKSNEEGSLKSELNDIESARLPSIGDKVQIGGEQESILELRQRLLRNTDNPEIADDSKYPSQMQPGLRIIRFQSNAPDEPWVRRTQDIATLKGVKTEEVIPKNRGSKRAGRKKHTSELQSGLKSDVDAATQVDSKKVATPFNIRKEYVRGVLDRQGDSNQDHTAGINRAQERYAEKVGKGGPRSAVCNRRGKSKNWKSEDNVSDDGGR